MPTQTSIDSAATAFVTRHFTEKTQAELCDISALVVCAEKPNIGCVEGILEDIVQEAPPSVSFRLKGITQLRHEWRSAAYQKGIMQELSDFQIPFSPTFSNSKEKNFDEDTPDISTNGAEELIGCNFSYAPVNEHFDYNHAANACETITWSPSEETQSKLKAAKLLSNDGITEETHWFDAFVKQVSAIRLCHVRHISKKGCDLTGERHFDAHLTPEDHASFRGRVEAAMEVLGTANIPLQAKKLLFKAVEKSAYDFKGPLDIHVLRPVKDYADHSNSYNFLTAVYTKMLRDALKGVARTYFPTSEIRVHDEPVMMLTKTNRTDADSLGRIVKQPLFQLGDIQGKNVIVADDHVNAGAFTTTLVSQAEDFGANVVGVASFSRHPNSGELSLKPCVKKSLLTLHPQEQLDELLGRVGVSVDTLTNREGLTLLSILMDGANDNHRSTFHCVMTEVNGEYNNLLDGIGDDLDCELSKAPKTPRELLQEIDDMFRMGSVR